MEGNTDYSLKFIKNIIHIVKKHKRSIEKDKTYKDYIGLIQYIENLLFEFEKYNDIALCDNKFLMYFKEIKYQINNRKEIALNRKDDWRDYYRFLDYIINIIP